ncbi:squalene/phytoene synthase [Diaporthe helianthi]|uniref:Bifunctional lycopene cyclase/phytoene synthase n=1 Tax=Diaporthe helianthi TaxID=158607 RepID=A0A2P5IAR2_DIAHE|nr:squalene/phytoene synthase [Diaporthe helianthi]
MAYDYALVHLTFTIPLATALTVISHPFLTRRQWYQTSVLVLIAVAATIPWDSYLIRHNVWTYPPDAVVGPTLLSIPAEELFFFVIQTYITSLLYHMLKKPLLQAEYLGAKSPSSSLMYRAVQLGISGLTLLGCWLVSKGGIGTYLGLILIWAGPFALLTWTLGGLFMATLPWTSVALPIALPTLYLWVVDELALRRGTWAIESGTKLGVTVWGSLEVEEAIFFAATNVLIVFGLGAFDNAVAVIDALPDVFEYAQACPSPTMLIKALFVSWTPGRRERIAGIQEAVGRLCRKSRSFYLASSTFSGRLRIDLILLYSYCRMADDLVDEPPEGLDTSAWITKLSEHLDLVYKQKEDTSRSKQADMVSAHITDEFPPSARSALSLLPASLLPSEPLYLLLAGFRTDSKFQQLTKGVNRFPIVAEHDIYEYGRQVAGTVGELCLALISHHSRKTIDPARREAVATAARRMGVALQFVNIARDIAVDAALGRVYLPTEWLAEEGLTPALVIQTITACPTAEGDVRTKERSSRLQALENLRRRLLGRAFEIYAESKPAMDWLPDESRRPMMVAVESYMEIGRVLLETGGPETFRVVRGRPTRATVPKLRRLTVALRALVDA